MADKMSEADNRKELIDPMLERVGWKNKERYVKEKNNPIKSKFKQKEYVGIEAGIEKRVERFIDYLLIDKRKLDAIISMPSGVFKPYAGVSTAVLFFTKTEQSEPTEKVWYYDMKADGFSLDDKRSPTKENDIPNIIERFENRFKEANEDRKKKHIFETAEKIKKNNWDLLINSFQKDDEVEVKYRPSKVIIKEDKKEITELLEKLNKLENIKERTKK